MSDPGVQRSLILTRLIFYVVFHRVSVAESGTKSKLQVYYCRAAHIDQRLFGGGVVEFYPVAAALGAEVQGAGGIWAVNQALSEVGSAVHKLVETHPISDLKYLNVNQAFTRHILDLNQGQSDEILQYLFQQVKRPEFQVRLRWRDNTIAIWDNRITQHYAVCDYLPQRRHMQRVTVTRDRRE